MGRAKPPAALQNLSSTMTQASKDKLMWLFTILGVPTIIIVTFWLNGSLGFKL